ncbi:hypothetical protein [Clostridium haemolyticum]|uniref:Peptidase S1 domain-containing protein n=1 Tax=Clostridium haemolyticum NCTC 9693 TaxID=1443114 RepID=A0ABR4TBV2_CLOHA|nr:hypothetical protein [Clostridium haemolyticum]KEI15036.1 hypothetical protein Z960_01495 [Clostridium haemolyticum NCTC 9693]KGN01352.1 hypothetical protein Z961_09170 [Clostridium haemolyticum NCTC 8350]OOB75776.1 hypothetical protein AXF41_06620 [Clostridium haemolyticum]
MYDYNSLEKRILYIARCNYNYFFKKANVTGVGLGYKVKNGFHTTQKCIKVFVDIKVSKNNISLHDLIPSYYDGIETDVEQIGISTMCSLKDKVRPVDGGYNISPLIGSPSGTLGCLVTDGKFIYLLSNCHVLATNGDTPLDCPILQPGRKYGGKDPEDKIATLSKYIEPKYITPTSSPENFVDCAIAKVTDLSKVSNKIKFLGNIKGIAPAILGENVQKVGCTTELTKGKIIALGVTITIQRPKGNCIFKNQILTNKMGEKGDSGSILLDSNLNALGLLMSASLSSTGFNPITSVLDSLKVQIVY